jgi:hypothetical protein
MSQGRLARDPASCHPGMIRRTRAGLAPAGRDSTTSIPMFWFLAILAVAGGLYVGLGAPGMPGREDRVVTPGRARRLKTRHIHWLKTRR